MRNNCASVLFRIGMAILFVPHAGSLIAQHANNRSGPFGDAGDRASGDTLEVPPGFSFTASYYYWVDASPGSGVTDTADIALATPVAWIGSLTFPAGQISTDCSTPFLVMLRVNAPANTGIYTVDVVDLTTHWPTWELIIKVVDIPTSFNNTITDTVLVNVAAQSQGTAPAVVGVDDVACPPQPYYPTSEIYYEYAFHPPAPWVTITPDSVVVAAGATEYPAIQLLSSTDGLFTTYRYRAGAWYFWPQILKYEVLFLLSTEVPALLPDVNGMKLYPNPALNTLNVEMTSDRTLEGWLVLTDLFGREVLRSPRMFAPGEDREQVDVSHLSAGAYACRFVVPGSGSTAAGRVVVVR